MGTGICHFLTGKMGLGSLGLGVTNKEVEMGLGFGKLCRQNMYW